MKRPAGSRWRPNRAHVALVLCCVVLIVLASAERRLWESDFNNAGFLLIQNGDTGKVINALVDADRAGQIDAAGFTLDTAGRARIVRPASIPLHVIGRPESRAPPK